MTRCKISPQCSISSSYVLQLGITHREEKHTKKRKKKQLRQAAEFDEMVLHAYDVAAAALLEHAEPLEETPEQVQAGWDRLVQHLRETGQWRE